MNVPSPLDFATVAGNQESELPHRASTCSPSWNSALAGASAVALGAGPVAKDAVGEREGTAKDDAGEALHGELADERGVAAIEGGIRGAVPPRTTEAGRRGAADAVGAA
mmetsp:Transcript_129938/g.277473  ORF Transcript_129938/g.277473 Transcript_129938/m.277473 type:complete len:109 (-) Transcript_129938:105-431(-)